MTIVGTRPEVIKLAPVLRELGRHADRFDSILVSTGQHRELLDQALRGFSLHPQVDLGLMEPEQTIGHFCSKALWALSDVIDRMKPDAVLVQGDTMTVAMGALAAFYSRVVVGHVEAGLRSFDRTHPFPEELNRELAGLVADLHFVPTERAELNLLRIGVSPERIIRTGNTVVDAINMVQDGRPFDEPALDRILPRAGRLIVATVHRRESIGQPLRNICRALRIITREHSDVHLIFPVHPNPVVSDIVHAELGGRERIHMIAPVSYHDMLRLMRSAYMLLSDSGGIQEEAPSLNVPLLVLRDVTERPEAIESGAARLVGTSTDGIVNAVTRLLSDPCEYESMRGIPNPFGDGRAAERVVEALWRRLHREQPMASEPAVSTARAAR